MWHLATSNCCNQSKLFFSMPMSTVHLMANLQTLVCTNGYILRHIDLQQACSGGGSIRSSSRDNSFRSSSNSGSGNSDSSSSSGSSSTFDNLALSVVNGGVVCPPRRGVAAVVLVTRVVIWYYWINLRTILYPTADIVHCGQRSQHKRDHRKAIHRQRPPQFAVAIGHNFLKITICKLVLTRDPRRPPVLNGIIVFTYDNYCGPSNNEL